MDEACSKSGLTIRLTEERWLHITEGHPELAGCYFEVLETVSDPDAVYEGNYGAMIAKKKMDGKHLVMIYKEIGTTDGFVITAFLTKKPETIERRRRIWPA